MARLVPSTEFEQKRRQINKHLLEEIEKDEEPVLCGKKKKKKKKKKKNKDEEQEDNIIVSLLLNGSISHRYIQAIKLACNLIYKLINAKNLREIFIMIISTSFSL